MSNSPLVDYIEISPNKNSPRNHIIDTITIHCVVGQCTIEALGHLFASPSRQACSNYGVGYDGRIGLYCDEGDRSWCSSSPENDHRAITIEVASDTYYPYKVYDAAYNSLILLVADICKRNNIKKLIWSDNRDDRVNHKNGCNMTCHRDFADTVCPGQFLYEREYDIANKVNEILNPAEEFHVGDIVRLKPGANKDINGKYINVSYLNSVQLHIENLNNSWALLYSQWPEVNMYLTDIEKVKIEQINEEVSDNINTQNQEEIAPEAELQPQEAIQDEPVIEDKKEIKIPDIEVEESEHDMWTKEFWKDTAERVIYTMVETAIGLITGCALLSEIDWMVLLSSTGIAGLVTFLKCLLVKLK